MVKAKNINGWFIVLIILIAIAISRQYTGRTTIIPDHMVILDDFTFLNEQLWDLQMPGLVSVSGGFANTGSLGHPGCVKLPDEQRQGRFISKKLWATEDLKVKYSYSYRPDGNCPDPDTPVMYFGQTQLPIYFQEDYHSDPYMHYQNAVIEIKRYDDTDLSKYVILVDGIEVTTGTNTEPVTLSFGAGIIVDYVKFEPYYSCVIDYETEVVVRDRFAGGSLIDIDTLYYTPLKFCPQDLGVLIFSEEGLTDEKGSITQALAEGNSLVVPEGQYWQIDYVAKYVIEMAERCNEPGTAYDTDLRQCVAVARQQDWIQCRDVYDCPVFCDEITVGCINNQCVYSGECLTPPVPGGNLWTMIQGIWDGFWNFITKLFGG